MKEFSSRWKIYFFFSHFLTNKTNKNVEKSIFSYTFFTFLTIQIFRTSHLLASVKVYLMRFVLFDYIYKISWPKLPANFTKQILIRVELNGIFAYAKGTDFRDLGSTDMTACLCR